ncbi:hypothetical protein [Cellulomonas denverensis]|uniref:Uncharacterized protein n=1 Tax=Cellulomonas denverensis TaxID=264297 RepID=A0A7X6KUA9_9CELL|nr:hypothetical protein [Cellulomonas denverensis]NKY22215.1 hypothetical protein [Cellulomonas denverensis]GIG27181.1 hypothetical protein Cde04nite_34250 [Cellulomonas denverensis]
MAELSSPYDGAVITVPDDLVDRYTAAGWVSGKKPAETPQDGAPKGNASREAWAEYADSLGVEYPAEAKQKEIRAAVEAAQKPAETPQDGADTGETGSNNE